MDPSKQSATSQTGYKWAFASKRTKADNNALQAARAEVGAATYGVGDEPSTTASSGKRVQGPALPPLGDRILAQEAAEEMAAAEREYQRKREKVEARERLEDMVGPREVGRERMLEKKRERREGDRAFRERGDEGLEVDEGMLLGGGDSFKAQWVQLCITYLVCLPCPGLPAETQRVRDLSKNAELHATREYRSVQRRSVKRTRQRWICSCRWPRRSTDRGAIDRSSL